MGYFTPNQKSNAMHGFTIVELLIVIVVIAILAAISVVAYSGIQQRAYNSGIISHVQTFAKALALDYADKGRYYTAGYGCLGANYPNNRCWEGDNGTLRVSTALNARLLPYLNNTMPTVATELFPIGAGNNRRAGVLYSNTSGGTGQWQLVYYLKGINQDCGIGSPYNEGGVVTQCSYILPNQ